MGAMLRFRLQVMLAYLIKVRRVAQNPHPLFSTPSGDSAQTSWGGLSILRKCIAGAAVAIVGCVALGLFVVSFKYVLTLAVFVSECIAFGIALGLVAGGIIRLVSLGIGQSLRRPKFCLLGKRISVIVGTALCLGAIGALLMGAFHEGDIVRWLTQTVVKNQQRLDGRATPWRR